MPEAPVIRLLAENAQQFVGQKILKATALTDDLDLKRVEGQTIKAISVFGKQLLIQLPTFTIRIHLMLFGYVRINDKKEDGKLRLGLQFENGEINFYACDIFFIDELLDQVFDLTTDVMSPLWDPKKALKKLNEQKEEVISDVLIDQDIFNGIGNKGTNEVLYRVKVHPGSRVGALQANKQRDIVKEAVDFSFDYLDWERKGVAKDHFAVYLKKKCPVHGTALRHEKIGKNGRKCHFCDECQKLYT